VSVLRKLDSKVLKTIHCPGCNEAPDETRDSSLPETAFSMVVDSFRVTHKKLIVINPTAAKPVKSAGANAGGPSNQLKIVT
jgi:hypothetical protein